VKPRQSQIPGLTDAAPNGRQQASSCGKAPGPHSGGESGSVEPGDEAWLAQVRVAQCCEAPREHLGLVVALCEFLQVPEQGDGVVVTGWLLWC
jgi:hypothetical protein